MNTLNEDDYSASDASLHDDVERMLARLDADDFASTGTLSVAAPTRPVSSLAATLAQIKATLARQEAAEPRPVPEIVKVPGRRRRRSPSRDRENVGRLWHRGPVEGSRQYIRGEDPFPLKPSKPLPSPVEPLDDPSIRSVPTWEDTTDIGKLHAYNQALSSFGEPRAFSLNLSLEKIASFNSNHGKASGDGFAAKALKEIARQLRKALGRDVPLWIAVDVNGSGRLHVHGGLSVTDNELPAAEAALKRAGGLWKARGREKHLDTRPQWKPSGWTSYALKFNGAVRSLIKGRQIAVSRELARGGRALYDERRLAVIRPVS